MKSDLQQMSFLLLMNPSQNFSYPLMEMILPLYFLTVVFGGPTRTLCPLAMACLGTYLSSILGLHIPKRAGLDLAHLYSLHLLALIKYLAKLFDCK